MVVTIRSSSRLPSAWALLARCAVQSGPLKDTSIRATYTAHRASKAQADGSLDELRIVTTIPFNIL